MQRKRMLLPFAGAVVLLAAVLWEAAGSGAEGLGASSAFAADGAYSDWETYPHTTLDEAGETAAALYMDDETLYGHFTFAGDLDDSGLENGVVLRFNEEDSQQLTLRLAAAAESGVVAWNPQLSPLEDGTYVFYLMDESVEEGLTTLHDLQTQGNILGKLYVTVEDGAAQCEFEVGLQETAALLGLEQGDLKTAACRLARLGEQWATLAGASTGPVFGVLLSCAGAALCAAAGCQACGRRGRR